MAINFMNAHTGSVKTGKDWFSDYKSMDPIEWFGYDIEDESCDFSSYPVYKNEIEMIRDTDYLVQVKKYKGHWVEV